MTDQIPAEIIGAETESQDYQHRGELRREYVTRITVAVNTCDLTRIDLTRPIMIHQEADTPTGPDHLAVGTVIESADDPRLDALPVGTVLVDCDGETVAKRSEAWAGLGYIPIESEGDEFGPWTVRRIGWEDDQ